MTLNTWGLPAAFGAKDKELRMAEISKYIAKQEYDVYMLQELWMRPDHATIQTALPSGSNHYKYSIFKLVCTGFHMTSYGDLTKTVCDGMVLPTECSGLAIVSRYAFIDVSFKHSLNMIELIITFLDKF